MNNYREDVDQEELTELINMAKGSLCRFINEYGYDSDWLSEPDKSGFRLQITNGSRPEHNGSCFR